MRCDVFTLFPEMILPVVGSSMLKRAREKALLEIQVHNLRDYTIDKHKVADDVPYGGGAGMVMKAEPILRAVDDVCSSYGTQGDHVRLLLPSPQGRPFTQSVARELAGETRRLMFICGHYEGIDERVRLALQPEEISVGDYILTGGELAALVVIDAAARLVPGVLGDPESIVEESFSESLLEYPHYTRPSEVRGMTVPDVLLSGHHEAIRLWRRKEALRATYQRRPDLLDRTVLKEEDHRLLGDIIREGMRGMPVRCGGEE
ncbi:tRNA (guanine-1-)-methyltransferase [Nitrospira sp. KM1]|uniref:tRNA (guanosine(37)-N1)-methyltransferase TrmD n=1 Tax=Nitrospira sp. KM1 TaxID=1936990 RepID=UPI0013A71481|nr:tRNA (guanosine(37)-N1)-methyltransferase TrmD [Nitrospira sp. KM1]BCA54290.1 tRNA (guanine-1-)-methyltransferase [Nitrospira sp. KM1]